MKFFYEMDFYHNFFYVPAWFIFMGGRDVTLGLAGMYFLMTVLLDIGYAIHRFANKEL